jgi:hypothetical protein
VNSDTEVSLDHLRSRTESNSQLTLWDRIINPAGTHASSPDDSESDSQVIYAQPIANSNQERQRQVEKVMFTFLH